MSHQWERRWHPVLGEWVVISANTSDRPWSGREWQDQAPSSPRHDPGCYLCPSSQRAGGGINPPYEGPWAFDNDFPSLGRDAPLPEEGSDSLYQRAPAQGLCRVLCWHPRHDLSLGQLSEDELLRAMIFLRDEYQALAAGADIRHVMMFENKGREVGVSNPHPHGQAYASTFVPLQIETMRKTQHDYATSKGGRLISQWICSDEARPRRVDENESFISAVPFAARFPYECWIVPQRPAASLGDFKENELLHLGLALRAMTRRYDLLFQKEAPNITLFHNAPVDRDPRNSSWQFHLVLQQPLRDPTKLKYLAGYESGTNCFINPIEPETAAQRLRDVNLEAWS